MMQERKYSDRETKRYWAKTISIMFLFLAALIAGAILLMPFHWPFGFIVWLVLLVGGGLYLLVRWHAKNTAYICPKCNHTFAISTLRDFLSPHMIEKKLLRCPECGESSWCKAVSIKTVKGRICRVEGKKIVSTPAKSLYLQIGIVLLVYLILWVYTLFIYSQLPQTIPTHFDLSLNPDAWRPKSSILILPVIAVIFPLFQGIFGLYAARQGYKSLIYYLLTGINLSCLLIFLGIQYLTLLKAM